jgi:O-antigen/teichoic acid export membrane protein
MANIILWLLSYLAAYFFKEDILQLVIKVMGIKLLIFSIQAVPQALMQKEGKWKMFAFLDFVQPLLTSVTTVILAFLGWGLWSIISGSLFGAVVKLVLVYIVHPWRPNLYFNFRIAKKLISFGKWVIAWTGLTFILDTADNTYLARFRGAEYLGFYTLPFTWITYPIRYILYKITTTLFPTFAGLTDAKARNHILLRITDFAFFVLSPLFLYLTFSAPFFVRTIFGDKWLHSIEILRWLSLYGITRCINELLCNFFMATKKPAFGVIPQLSTLFLIGIGFLISWGTWNGVAVAQCFTAALVFRAILSFFFLAKNYDINILRYMLIIVKALIPAAMASALSYFSVLYTPVSVYLKFIFSLLLFFILYILCYSSVKYKNPLKLFFPGTWKEILKQFKK